MNWDRLKAKDLLALFNSFKPKGGVVLSVTVTIPSLPALAPHAIALSFPFCCSCESELLACICQIYPSEFGKERMSAEQTQGPLELASLPEDPEADTEEQRYWTQSSSGGFTWPFSGSYWGLSGQDLQYSTEGNTRMHCKQTWWQKKFDTDWKHTSNSFNN